MPILFTLSIGMEIFIQHQGQQTGPFSLQQIQSGFLSGLYQHSDLIWHQGIEGWIPLSTLLNNNAAATVSPQTVMPLSSGLALTSMILGVSSFACLITSIPAIICGHIASSQIKKSDGRITGKGFAIAGLITGYLGIGITLMALLTIPMIMSQVKVADRTEALSNAKSFGIALYTFHDEFGSYPSAETASLVAKETSTPAEIGESSNARFRQLIRAGMVSGEETFYAKTYGSQKPDGDISGSNAIAPGECGFAYIDNIPSNPSHPRPIAIAPFKSGSDEFDPLPFNNKAIILWTDNSATLLPIDPSGQVLHNGQHILDPKHPIWEGTPPVLLLPE
jgi:hypothetical protein